MYSACHLELSSGSLIVLEGIMKWMESLSCCFLGESYFLCGVLVPLSGRKKLNDSFIFTYPLPVLNSVNHSCMPKILRLCQRRVVVHENSSCLIAQ